MSVVIHIGISLIFLVILESVGIWLLVNKLVFDPSRIYAAHWVFQFSILSAIVTIMTVPYDAVVVANQRMKFYAYCSIFDGLLRLGVIFLLSISGNDKLILYAFLTLLASIIIRFVNVIYCKRNFPECKFQFVWNKKRFKEMGAFAGWNLAGNFSYSLVTEGVNICFNMFGGVVYNAARAITYQVSNAVLNLLSNVLVAVKPQITIYYSKEQYKEFEHLFYLSTKIIIILFLLMSTPIYMFTDTILYLWLGTVPPHCSYFIKAILVYILIRAFHNPIDLVFLSSGKLKEYQILELCILTLSFPLCYFSLKYQYPAYYVFIIMAIVELINLVCVIILAKYKIGIDMKLFFMTTFLKVLVPISILLVHQFYFASMHIVPSMLDILFLILIYLAIFSVMISGSEKKELIIIVKKFVFRKN